ncbi:MAG: acyltransferase [Hymenobacter sp.]|nr:MAG: acyltransferase [Hymenobacter sp.]
MEPELRHKPIRYYEIDLLRFIAALAVVLYHFAFRGYHADNLSPVEYPALGEVFKYGYLGVELFFIISGYVVLMSAQGKTLGQFFTSRVTRLYPAYWVACTFTFLVERLFGPAEHTLEWSPALYASLRVYLANMTMVQNFIRIADLDGVYWTLKLEIIFYLLLAILILLKWFRYLVPILLIWLIYCAVIGPVTHGKPLTFLLFPRFAPFFIAGMLFYMLQTNQSARWKLYGLLLVTYGLALRSSKVLFENAIELYHYPYSLPVTWILITSFFVVFILITHRLLQISQTKWIALAGALTYPIYLLHHNVGYIVFKRLGNRVNKYELLLGMLLVLFGLAYLLHTQVERRYTSVFSRVLQKFFAKF